MKQTIYARREQGYSALFRLLRDTEEFISNRIDSPSTLHLDIKISEDVPSSTPMGRPKLDIDTNQIIYLREAEELSYKEIAAKLKCSMGLIYDRLPVEVRERTRRRIRERRRGAR